ncbi:hypothetical protein GIV75_22360 [Pseudomonas sp. PA-3-5D]|uniref:hypothetical protein n=5 Tax=Pseudomonas TaxID=286 RepID=UPI00190BB07F|nr:MULTISPECIES: hypothetical protein [unclassified Pseudomonas]MBK3434403.1 hypothetical protein [Pseudomonas fluorescens]MBK3480315.1 hypothetical protein [Pseudomonas fluorescens]MCF5517411.1 hypothetical protein [Pseudomonas sp. PA-3-6E]MCF5563610.1 hypothetical protein [Pseudomonas sp. PA-3-5D]BDB17747.1 hypothetical protein cym2001_11120 [Pseudomonas sp. CYM-20-01]
MPVANWDVFSELSGAPDENFEKLCRSLVRRHYGRYGRFKQLANQPGVEFHLQLTESCDLGAPPRWIGWQCKWYELANGQDLGATRKQKIIEGMEKTRKHVPGVTDWKLWTHHTLTKGDQEWFFALEKDHFPELKLELLTATDIEDLLVGPGALLREAYFGELVLSPVLLAEQHRLAAAPFKRRYQNEVHVVVRAEQKVHRHLGSQGAWDSLEKLSSALKMNCTEIASLTGHLKVELKAEVDSLLARSVGLAGLLDDLYTALGKGNFDSVHQMLAANPPQPVRYDRLLSKLRGARTGGAPLTANLVADIHAVSSALLSLKRSIGVRAVAVLAAAGEGKSELAVKVTQPDGDLPGGVLLLGKNLHAGQGLDDLVSAFKISGRPAESFDRLVEAVDAAGQRAGKRIPIVIDGLNEAEDPRNWRDELARAEELLEDFPYVLLVVTLRNEFAQMCLPEDFPQVEHNGFQEDPQAAIDRYFEYYKIDATDADLPIEFLQHPLTLRIFCEVANPRRQHPVGVEALPSSLASLFEEHFNKVAARVAELLPTAHRIYQEEVQDALLKIASLLWEGNARSLEFNATRTAVRDMGWDASIIRALESEGVLVRTTSEEGGQRIAFSYDLMAGHMMARHLLERPDLALWLRSDEGRAHFQFGEPGSHTFAFDVFRALVGLYPQRVGRRQLWQDLSDENLVMNALLLTAQSDPKHIGRETVERFARAMQESRQFAHIAFTRLRSTRAARAHPFDMDFSHGVLLAMPNTQRDLVWSEWVREKTEEVENDLKFLSVRWKSGVLDEREIRRARWVMWTLTSTSRSLRDVATKTLYEFAVKRPGEFFRLAVESTVVSDPYVPERMFAAVYGAALTTWSDINAVEMREALPRLAREIYRAMFAPSATHPTWHALYQQYCLGTIAIARMVDPACLSEDEATHLLPPFSHLTSPFANMPQYAPAVIERAKRAAIGMDFGNYTIGTLIPGRSNYDDRNPEYQLVLPTIVSRMLVLGYDPEQFESVDLQMNSGPRMGSDKHKVDRYGKKYGWIAYFEMWGVRYAQGLLAEERSTRPSDADIDPSFPRDATSIDLKLPDLFSEQPTSTGDWIVKGPAPDYKGILEIAEIDGLSGPWIVLDGFLQEKAPTDYRQFITFLRGVLVDSGEVERLLKLFDGLVYPGNYRIPNMPEHHYTYAGEMPFPSIPGLPVADEQGRGPDEDMVSAEIGSSNGIAVDIPVQKYSWESHHSVENQAGGAIIPSKLICEALSLRYLGNVFDLHDPSGIASLYREVGEYDSKISGSFSYLRRDLLDSYLSQSGKSLVWLMWGERSFHNLAIEVEYFANDEHIHKRAHVYQPASRAQS